VQCLKATEPPRATPRLLLQGGGDISLPFSLDCRIIKWKSRGTNWSRPNLRDNLAFCLEGKNNPETLGVEATCLVVQVGGGQEEMGRGVSAGLVAVWSKLVFTTREIWSSLVPL